MKKILLVCFFWLFALAGFSQNQITEYEYWIDDDIANRTSVNLSSPSNNIAINELVDLSTVSDGLHSISIRFKDTNKVWSNTVNKLFTKRETLAPSQSLHTLQYWFDNDLENEVTTTFASTDKLDHSDLIDLSALSNGMHLVNYRVKNEANIWSCVVSKQIIKREALAASQKLNTIQYWFDNDIESAITSTFVATNQLDHSELIDLSTLSGGMHLLNYRIKNEANIWSCVVSKQIIKREALVESQKLNTLQYWFDNNVESAITSTFAATNQLDHSELIDLSTLSGGMHLLNYRIKNEANIWSCVVSEQIIKRENNTQAHQLTTVQYWFDSNIENIVTTTIPASDKVDSKELIELSELPVGLHVINVRIKDESNIWSSVITKQFIKRPIQQVAKLNQYRYWFNDDLTNLTTVTIDPITVKFSLNEMVDVLSIPPGVDQTISYQFKDDQGNWSVPLSDTINRIAVVKASFTADNTEKCGSLTVQFNNNSTDGESYLWDFGDGNTSTEIDPSYTYNTAGSYTVSLTATNDTYSLSDVSSMADLITIHAIPVVNLGADIQICEGNDHTFSIADNFAQYFWNDVEGTNELIAATEGDYNLKIIDANGCGATDVANLSFHSAAIINLGDDVQICEGGSHTFSIPDNFEQYFWNDVEGTYQFSTEVTGEYTLRVIDINGCEASDVVNLLVNPTPNIDLGEDILICEGNSHTFSVEDNFAQYFWNDLEGTNEIIATTEGNYSLRVIDNNGCEATDNVSLTISSISINLGQDAQICEGGAYSLSVPDNFTQYFWNDVEGTNEFSATEEGTYTLRVINANGCEATDEVHLTVFPASTIELGDNVIACEGSEHTFSVTDNFAQYFWNNVEGTNEFLTSTEGTYTLRVIDNNGCDATDDVNFSFYTSPSVDLGNDINICEGSEHIFSVADNFAQYFWNDVEGTNEIIADTEGNYSLKVIDANGCEATDAVHLSLYETPETPIVSYANGILSSTIENGYQWYLNNQTLSGFTAQQFTPEQDGNYSVEVWSEFGCKSSQSESVEVILVGIAGLLKENMSIYPNPTKGKLVIDLRNNFNHVSTLQLKLLDSSGKLILCKKLEPITTLDLSSYPSGLYFIHFINLNEAVSFKIVKQ
nr:PKD domain-containing protein [Labilibaculum sp.]